MKENTVVAFQNPSRKIRTEVLQAGAPGPSVVSVFLGAMRRLFVRDYLPERFIQTGSARERAPTPFGTGGTAPRFTSAILPRAPRQEPGRPFAMAVSKGSTGDFGEALAALLGSSAPGLSASTITRLKDRGGGWQRRDHGQAPSISGWTASISAPAWRKRSSASWDRRGHGQGTEGTDRHRRRLSESEHGSKFCSIQAARP